MKIDITQVCDEDHSSESRQKYYNRPLRVESDLMMLVHVKCFVAEYFQNEYESVIINPCCTTAVRTWQMLPHGKYSEDEQIRILFDVTPLFASQMRSIAYSAVFQTCVQIENFSATLDYALT